MDPESSTPPTDQSPLDSPSTPLPPPPPPPPPLPPPPDLSSLLSRFPPPIPPPIATPSRRQSSSESTDEKCWIFTSQSNARRALNLEPQIQMYCYINFRNSISNLIPVPGHPNAFLAQNNSSKVEVEEGQGQGPGKLNKVLLKSSRIGDVEKSLPNYWWKWLDGRYWYVAKGKTQVERHFKEMGGGEELEEGEEGQVNSWKMISKIEHRIKQEKELNESPEKKQERQIKRALKVIDLNENYESLTSISSLYSTTLQRFHSHLLRIYTPLLTSLEILPKTFTDGTQLELLSTCYQRLTDGSAFLLGERMFNSLGKVGQELKQRREKRQQQQIEQEEEGKKSRGSGGGGFGGSSSPPPPPPPVDVGLGGQQPRLPPPRSNNSIFGGTSPPPPLPPNQEDGKTGQDEGRRPKPPPYSPGCYIM